MALDMEMILGNKKRWVLAGSLILGASVVSALVFWLRSERSGVTSETERQVLPAETRTAVLSGGCFWCVEADFEKLPGVVRVVSGYTGGSAEHPTYQNYAEHGYREAVEVTYDPTARSYGDLVEYLIKHSDPTDGSGSFNDRGPQYAPAVYYETVEEQQSAEEIIRVINEKRAYGTPLALLVLPRVSFWPAEDYHQDYSKKNPIRYQYYRAGSGRDDFIKKHWGDNVYPTLMNTSKENTVDGAAGQWQQFAKPSPAELKAKLTPVQYEVTQEEGTEPPFANEYDGNKAEGLYVDILSGEPLYSSKDKYDSGTGWPSFTKPLSPESVTLHEDRGLFSTRTEVRSVVADSHLGHVFDDGPSEAGGKRYCMNSAALRFVPKEDLEREGYGEYLKLFEE